MAPRDYMKVRDRLLADCKRLGFAQIARYTKATDDGSGDTVTRASVHFALAAMRYLGNLDVQNILLRDDEKARIVRVQIVDRETDSTYSKDMVLEKVAERVKLAKGELATATRETPTGRVFLVRATEDDLGAKESDLASRVQRQLILKLLPADITAECMEQCASTIGDAGQPAGHPEEYRKESGSRAANLAATLKSKRKARA